MLHLFENKLPNFLKDAVGITKEENKTITVFNVTLPQFPYLRFSFGRVSINKEMEFFNLVILCHGTNFQEKFGFFKSQLQANFKKAFGYNQTDKSITIKFKFITRKEEDFMGAHEKFRLDSYAELYLLIEQFYDKHLRKLTSQK